MFMMWEYLGRHHNLDYTIFYPFDYHIHRDRTFNRYPQRFCRPHGRYIINGADLQLPNVPGRTRNEACFLYHSIFTPWEYIRYDEHAPTFLRVLLPTGRQFKFNPFYYNRMEKKEEILTTYKMLFDKLATAANHPIVVCNDPIICGLREKVSSAVYFFESPIKKHVNKQLSLELYQAPKAHFSALANEMRARELFLFLTHRSQPVVKALTLSLKSDFTLENLEKPSPLYQYEGVRVSINGALVSNFVIPVQKGLKRYLSQDLDFKGNSIWSVLWSGSPEGLSFIPTVFPVKNRDQIFASFKIDQKVVRVPIGHIEAQTSILGKLSLKTEGRIISPASGKWSLHFDPTHLRDVTLISRGELEDMKIELGENHNVILWGKEEMETNQTFMNALNTLLHRPKIVKWELHPVIAEHAFLRAKAGTFTLADHDLPESGTLDVLVTKKNGETSAYPMTSYTINSVNLPNLAHPYPFPIK